MTAPADSVTIRPFEDADLEDLVSLWNRAFAERRNFHRMTDGEFQRRLLNSPAFDRAGLILARRSRGAEGRQIVGIALALRPPPDEPAYRRWGRHHLIGLLFVDPSERRQGIGTRLLEAAEKWLHYCPVFVGGLSTPCLGGLERIAAPVFGSSDAPMISASEQETIRFFARRGYRIADAGEVSMLLDLKQYSPRQPMTPAPVESRSLRQVRFSDREPYGGGEPEGRIRYSTIGDNEGNPFAGLGLVDSSNMLVATSAWFPLGGERAGFTDFFVSGALRGQGLGRFLLDSALHDIAAGVGLNRSFASVELQTNLVRSTRAVGMYEARGFTTVEAWAPLVKT
jgi:GNAT superfamily N-acetyltransferase